MTTYHGPASVLIDNAEYEVTAQLVITLDRNLKEWHGSLQTDGEEAAWNIWDADQPRLSINGGTEGDFIVTNYQTGSNELIIQGSGPAPFGA
ncbi:hypothetical protein KQY30_24900 [Streptomyces sp. GMY02]|uniref:hypothetical protein n=1 Tax=Streptomyces sp. GMY02 TaxID=1333528 RepID=UPI001C2C8604|nr:hypothetical protein [Streptomyces sp. GMY02]QXE36966.1 hypothetical protein KQY30_24900 [Streptomyces sp. GMY02]